MDAALKARKLGSAASRRQRIEMRQLEREHALQARSRHKKQVMSEIIALEGFSSESESEFHSETSSNADPDSAAETASESDVQTPQEPPSPDIPIQLSPATYDPTIDTITFDTLTKDPDLTLLSPQSRPRMQATLTTMADWNYDRFSVLLDPTDVEELATHITEAEEPYLSDSSQGEELEDSPVEIAMSIVYTTPKGRPLVVSIFNKQSHNKLVTTIETSTIEAYASRGHSMRRTSVESPLDTFKAGEAKLFQMSNSSYETVESTTNSSHPSRSLSITSQNESFITRSISQASEVSHQSPKRKSSLPLMFGGNKAGHSRISSIKKLIRTSTLGPPTAHQPWTSTLQRHPSTSILETHFESRTSSSDEPRAPIMSQLQRPMTARVPSSSSSFDSNTKALPAVPPRPFDVPDPRPSSRGSEEIQVKPVSRFRKRGGSIGQALKSIGSGPRKADASAPPVPALFVPSTYQVVNDKRYPTLPPVTPRDPRRSNAYSPFPFADKRTSSQVVGLGLQY